MFLWEQVSGCILKVGPGFPTQVCLSLGNPLTNSDSEPRLWETLPL